MITVSGYCAAFEHGGERFYASMWADGTVAISSVAPTGVRTFLGYAHEMVRT